ncbi:hypothetical protein NMY22_g17899 [Coprinellus aureogranulatus]|nr:hypothetical protein NMY22_g17899 [Coprinellus aureogranulatus]
MADLRGAFVENFKPLSPIGDGGHSHIIRAACARKRIAKRTMSFSNTVEAEGMAGEIFLDNKYDPESDIAVFLEAKFSQLRRRYRLPMTWPGKDVTETLCDRASGQFVYAATVARSLQTSKLNPQARLDWVMGSSSLLGPGEVTSSLDALYIRILKSSPNPALSTTWLRAIDTLKWRPALIVRQLLQEYPGQADYLLENLASLVYIPPMGDASSPFRIYHKSLVDFLSSPTRTQSGPLASICMTTLSSERKRMRTERSYPTWPLEKLENMEMTIESIGSSESRAPELQFEPEEQLRAKLCVKPGHSMNLWSLPYASPGERPPHSYPVLVWLAIYGSPDQRLTLNQIFSAIEERFEYYRNQPGPINEGGYTSQSHSESGLQE